ncbi:MAG: DNA repair protein RadA [Proteobacteria bacterium]|nr:DNA repair protein RadA [Pseudomonadota bacterium]
MAKPRLQYVCQQCGALHGKWAGRCSQCNTWNSINRDPTPVAAHKLGGRSAHKGTAVAMHTLHGESTPPPRLASGIKELDRVLGGGIVTGSAVLLGGAPGIGKSTLLLQLTYTLAKNNIATAYFTGEESIEQIRMRAQRLGMLDGKSTSTTSPLPIRLASATNTEDICAAIESDPPPVVIIDSIQTMYLPQIDSVPGSVNQIRGSAFELIRVAKEKGVAVILTGHITKEGMIAGPKLLEHMVDTVLYFEGDANHHFRILRGSKNRFGATDEIGVFDMQSGGLMEVANPSQLFLEGHKDKSAGAVVFAGMEGSRPILVEIQALVAPSVMANPRRNVVGWDAHRLAMLTAVLETRGRVALSQHDIFLNVAGGVRINEPAADLAVATALLTSLQGSAPPSGAVFFGEVGLSAETRRVAYPELRLKEAAKLGFTRAIMPMDDKAAAAGIATSQIGTLKELVAVLEDNSNGKGKGKAR